MLQRCCPICLEEGASEVPRCPRGCAVAFHPVCLRGWESHHGASCPTCRTPMHAVLGNDDGLVMVVRPELGRRVGLTRRTLSTVAIWAMAAVLLFLLLTLAAAADGSP